MALFTDAGVITLDNLVQYENTLVQIASSHSINVNTKINLASGAVGDRVMQWLLNIGMSDPQMFNRRLLGLSTVVLGPTLQRWLSFESLTRFFAEAYNLQLNTRFQAKLTEYQQEAKGAADGAFQAGIGIVFNPLPKPALPLVSVQTGTAPTSTWFIQTAWVDITGHEGALSPVNGLLLPAESSISVAMAEGVLQAPGAAFGWNVYIGWDQGDPRRQNDGPLPIGSTWQLPATGLSIGAAPIDGQLPDYYIRTSRQILRG